MIKILDATKTLPNLVSDTTNGIGQIDVQSCLVTEELNGIYECEFNLLATDKHFGDLSVGGIIKVPVNETGDEQLFRIYFISKPMNEVVNVKCQHITYDLNKVPVSPFSATGAVAAKNGMLSHIVGTYPFTMTTDIDNSESEFVLDIPRSFRECLGGYEGSLLDTFRGEYEYDNLTVKMLAHRGSDNNVRISYGKNLTDFTQEENNENVYTAVLGYAVVDDTTYTGNVYNKIVSRYPKVKIVDFSQEYESGTVPTTADLTAKAQDYADRNSIEIPAVNITVSFVPLYQTEEYKNIAPLERVSLGDTVHIFFEKLNVEASARVIKTVWNANLNRYDSVELGDAKSNLNTVINDSVDAATTNILDNIDIDTGFIENQLNEMGNLIINGLGLHSTNVPVAGGGYRMYLHNKETLEESDTQFVITSEGFLVSTDYGQTWNAGFDSQGNVIVNSLATITLKALEIYGSTITFGDLNGKYITAAPYSVGGNLAGVSFDGNGYARFQPQEQFIVNNLASDSDLLNEFVMGSSGIYGQAFVTLKNYDHNNHLLANSINMDDNYGSNSAALKYNRLELANYSTKTGTQYLANSIQLNAKETQNEEIIVNNKFADSSNPANQIKFTAGATEHKLAIANYDLSDSYVANSIEWTTFSDVSFSTLSNFQPNSQGLANRLIMRGTGSSDSTGNYIRLVNYDPDNSSDTVSAQIEMTKTTSSNALRLQVYRAGTIIGYIMIYRGSSANVTISMNISNQTVNNHTYKGCSVTLDSSTGRCTLYGSGGVYANGTQIA